MWAGFTHGIAAPGKLFRLRGWIDYLILSWDAVAAGDAVLTLQPNRLDIGELRVERPAGRLIIAAHRTVNLMDVLKMRDASGRAPRAAAKADDRAVTLQLILEVAK